MIDKKENIKNILIKYEKIIALLVIIIAVSIFSFNVMIDANDELWNFSNVYKMSKGETIYQDCNVIVTPLFFYIGTILFKILGANMLTFRIYNLIIYTLLYYLTYLLLRKVKVNLVRTITYMIVFYIITCRMILVGANYNILAIAFALLGIINILKKEKSTFKDNIIQGILAFVVFMCKQNIGFFYVIGLVIYNIISRKNIKQIIKDCIVQFSTFIILLLCYALYLYSTDNLYNFINYTIFGIKEFGGSNLYYDDSIYVLGIEILICVFLACYLISNRNKIEEELKRNLSILLIFSSAMLGITYPIFNKNHMIIASIIFIITIIYFIDKIWLDKKIISEKIDKILKIINTMCIVGIITASISINVNYLAHINNNHKYKPYYGGIIKQEIQEEINQITTYILEQEQRGIDVKVISYRANLYMNVLNKNNGDMDLAFYGNLGKDGVDGLIGKIQNLKNTHILIPKGELKYQESEKVKDYVLNNLNKIGEIQEFYIFETVK